MYRDSRNNVSVAEAIEHKVTLTFEGGSPIEIACRETEDVISAALRQGVLLVSECREGLCGACRGFLQDGRYERLLDHSQHALSDQDEEEGWILACRLRPRSDVELDFDYPADRVSTLEHGRRSGRIVELDRCVPSVTRIVVRTISAQEPLRWDPGQYVRLHLADLGISRTYSIANIAGGGHELEFFIRLVDGGAFSNALKNMHGAGAPVLIEGPFGSFTLGSETEPPIFVAGGTGLVPILSMLRKLAADDPGREAILIFGVAEEDELFAQAELQAISAACPGLETYVTITRPKTAWPGEHGTAVEALARIMESRKRSGSHYYICGPTPMVDAACELVRRFDVPQSAIHREQFSSPGELS